MSLLPVWQEQEHRTIKGNTKVSDTKHHCDESKRSLCSAIYASDANAEPNKEYPASNCQCLRKTTARAVESSNAIYASVYVEKRFEHAHIYK